MSSSSLFRKPFSPKKAPARKATTISPLQMDAAERSREFMLDYTFAHMHLGSSYFTFDIETGEWYNETTGESSFVPKKAKNLSNKEMQKFQRENLVLQEQNNMLKVKNEILLDMVSELYSEYNESGQ